MLPVCSVRDVAGLYQTGLPPPPVFFVSVASKGLNVHVSGLESTVAGISISVDSKGVYVAPKLCNCLCHAAEGRKTSLPKKESLKG